MERMRATEARANFAALLRRVSVDKERIVIERRGRARAVMVPYAASDPVEGGAEQALRESEQRFRDFVEASSDWFWEMDEECRFSYFSDRFTEVTGVSQEALLGKTREETGIPDVDPEAWRKHLADLAGHRSFRDFRHPRTRADGRVVELSINGKAIFDEAGEFRGYRGTGSDVTERKQAEEALRQARDELERRVEDRTRELREANEALLRENAERRRAEDETESSRALLAGAVEALDVGFVLFDPDERLVLCNSRYREMYHGIGERLEPGITLEEVARGTAARGLGLSSPAAVEAWVRQRLERYRNPSGPGQQHLQDGRWILVSDRRLPSGWTVGIRTDISELKQAEQMLGEREAQIRQAHQIAKLGYWSWSPESDLLSFSPEMTAILGVPHEAADGMSNAAYAERFVHADDREFVKALDRQEASDWWRNEIEYRLVPRDGEVRWVREIGEAFKGEDDEVVGELGIIQDITEYKRAEAALMEREAQLKQAQKLEAVGQLTGGVAHDFNNLLGVILGNIELLSLQIGEDDPKLRAVLRAATRGAELTERLLAFSRQQALQPDVIELGALVGGMTDLLRRTLGETIEIKTAMAPGLWRAKADAGQVENALLNLALNARDAMPEGGTLVIETGNASLDEAYAAARSGVVAGDYAMLAVTDTGTGMTPEVLERAFEPFFTTKEVGQGSGLGLSMVYGFARQSDGHVAIYSEAGQGTTVKLYLPRTEMAAEQTGKGADEDVPRARGETVLVVEDDEDVRQLAVTLLQGLGYEILQAPDGGAALAIVEEAPRIDLLLSDVVLPGGHSGPDMADQAKRRRPGIKLLFMSGYAENAARFNGFAKDGAELLGKPFRRRELARKVRAALDR